MAPFGATLSGWWKRVGANLLDLLVLLLPLIVVYAVFRAAFGHDVTVLVGGRLLTERRVTGGYSALQFLVTAAISGSYFTRLNGLGAGQTVGNRATGIAVRDIDTGEPIGLKRSFVRWLVRTVLYLLFALPGIVSDLFPLWDKRSQTLADKAAKSVMIRLR
jgi:hypothetical protein